MPPFLELSQNRGCDSKIPETKTSVICLRKQRVSVGNEQERGLKEVEGTEEGRALRVVEFDFNYYQS